VKSGLVLKWSPTPSSNKSTPEPSRQVTLICFQPVPGIWLAINRLFKSDSWEDVLSDPYLLINASFETWYEFIDEHAWKLLDLSREAERVRYSRFHLGCKEFPVANCNGQRTFEHLAQLETDSSKLFEIDYHGIHNLAKDAIHLVEGLDAVLRSLECTLSCHSKIEKHDFVIWNATHDALHYRREMFHSTRLRMLSVEQRLKNVINMVGHFSSSPFCPYSENFQAFNIGTMRDSYVMRQDSYVMRTLSILAMIFLPISTVSSIFGTQFFTTTTSQDLMSGSGAVTSSFVVSEKFWLLWIISIPVTIILLVGWGVWIRRYQLNAKPPASGMKDVEKAKSA
jgi:hypothetical protein